MSDQQHNLYLYEAIELRNIYDRHIRLLERLVHENTGKSDRFFGRDREEDNEPAEDFNQVEIGKSLKKIQTKRVKLNQAIQKANYENQIEFRGESISIAEALEIRKNFISDLDAQARRVQDSTYNVVIHKEERDIVRKPKHIFKETYQDYQKSLIQIRELINKIHLINHQAIVHFKDE